MRAPEAGSISPARPIDEITVIASAALQQEHLAAKSFSIPRIVLNQLYPTPFGDADAKTSRKESCSGVGMRPFGSKTKVLLGLIAMPMLDKLKHRGGGGLRRGELTPALAPRKLYWPMM